MIAQPRFAFCSLGFVSDFDIRISDLLAGMMGVRIEQQAFAKHGLNYVLEDYLPEKLKKKTFLP